MSDLFRENAILSESISACIVCYIQYKVQCVLAPSLSV